MSKTQTSLAKKKDNLVQQSPVKDDSSHQNTNTSSKLRAKQKLERLMGGGNRGAPLTS